MTLRSSSITISILSLLVLLTAGFAGNATVCGATFEDGDGLPSELVAAIEAAQAERKPILIYAFNPI